MMATTDILEGIKCRKFIPKHIVYAVCGFVREGEELLPDTSYYHVIDPIVYLCTSYYAIDPMEEILEMQSMKQKVRDFYVKLDIDNNGDIDIDEFKEGMKRQNISMDEAQMDQLFKIMDSEQSHYLDYNDVISFLLTKWQNVELIHLQQPIINKIGNHNVPLCVSANNNNLIEWKNEMEEMELEMRDIVCNYKFKISEKHDTELKIDEEVERQQEDNDNFCAIERCQEWNKFEVCWYLDKLGFSNYVMQFVKHCIDGQILLNDLDEELLMIEFGMKRKEALRLLKETDRLKNSFVNIEECHQVIDLCYLNDRKLRETKQWNEAKQWIIEKLKFYNKEEQKCMDILQRLTVEHSALEQNVRPQMKQMMDNMNRINLKITKNDKIRNENRYQEELNFCKQNLSDLQNILVLTNNIRREVQNRVYEICELKIGLKKQMSNETFSM